MTLPILTAVALKRAVPDVTISKVRAEIAPSLMMEAEYRRAGGLMRKTRRLRPSLTEEPAPTGDGR